MAEDFARRVAEEMRRHRGDEPGLDHAARFAAAHVLRQMAYGTPRLLVRDRCRHATGGGAVWVDDAARPQARPALHRAFLGNCE